MLAQCFRTVMNTYKLLHAVYCLLNCSEEFKIDLSLSVTVLHSNTCCSWIFQELNQASLKAEVALLHVFLHAVTFKICTKPVTDVPFESECASVSSIAQHYCRSVLDNGL